MENLELVRTLFAESVAVKKRAGEVLPESLVAAGELICLALSSGRKIFSCGNGGSAADAQHFAAELVNRFETQRKALSAIALTTDTSILTSVGNDCEYRQIFSRQLEALGQAGDVLLAISTSGNSGNVNEAVITAHSLGMVVVALSANDGGELGRLLGKRDFELRVPTDSTARAQEVHLVILHCLCALLDAAYQTPD